MFLHFYKRKVKRAFILIGIITIVMTLCWGISESTVPYLRSIATYQVKSYVNTLLRDCVDQEFTGISRKEGSYDVIEIRKQLSQVLQEASNLLQESSNNDVIYELPMGALTQNVWLVNVGPMIPIRMKVLQEVRGEIMTEVVEYGLNNALLTIQVVLQVDIEVLSPYHLEEITIKSEIPLVIDVIEGNVPTYMAPW